MFINNYFNTAIWSEQKPEFVKSLNKASNKYVKEARKEIKILLKNMVTLDYHITQHHLQWTMIF